MRPPRAIGLHTVGFGLVHAPTIVLHPRSRRASCANFQGEDTYMPAGNVSDDICCVVERVHMPELHSRMN